MKIKLIVFRHYLVSYIKKKFDELDQWLCVKLPRPLRWRWCLLWIRKDEFHVAYSRDHTHEQYLLKKQDRKKYHTYMDRFMKHKSRAHELDLTEGDSCHGFRLN